MTSPPYRHPEPGGWITFEEAVAEGDSFELEGRRIPMIGRNALLANKRAAGREQDIADLKALELARKG